MFLKLMKFLRHNCKHRERVTKYVSKDGVTLKYEYCADCGKVFESSIIPTKKPQATPVKKAPAKKKAKKTVKKRTVKKAAPVKKKPKPKPAPKKPTPKREPDQGKGTCNGLGSFVKNFYGVESSGKQALSSEPRERKFVDADQFDEEDDVDIFIKG